MDLTDYLMIPYAAFGRTRAGVDCWGLVCLLYREKFDIELCGYEGVDWKDGETVAKCILEEADKNEWVEITAVEKRLGDVVVMRILGMPWHVGIVLSTNQFIHADPKIGICLERLDSPVFKHRVLGYHRHIKMS